MINKLKLSVGMFAISLLGLLAIGCGGGGSGSSSGSSHAVIIWVNGYYGYYSGNIFCDFTNNYCGTGISNGIGNNGTSCDGYYCPTNGSGNGSGNNGSGNIGNPLPGNNGSGNVDCLNSNCGNSGHGVDENSKDVNLQRGEVAAQDFEARVNANRQQFSMSVESARSLTQLSDRMNMLSTQGQLTADDRDALAHSALAVAGVDTPEVSIAVAKLANHDNSGVNALMDKAAANLGMSSSAGLRDQILPSFGIDLPK